MPTLAISMEKDMHTNIVQKKKSNSYKFICDIAETNFTSKTYIHLLNSILSKTLCVMFTVEQLFTKNYLFFCTLRSF